MWYREYHFLALASCFGGPVGCVVGVGLTAATAWYGAKAVNETQRILQSRAAPLKNEAADTPKSDGKSDTQSGTSSGDGNPYKGPVAEPVVVVDQHGNAIPVDQGQRINTSPNGDFQQVIGTDGKPTGID